MAEMLRSAGMRWFEPLVRELGGDPVPLLRRHRISLRALRDEEALIPFRSAAEMVEDAAAVLGCPDFGLRLGGRYDLGVLGPVGVALLHSGTVGEALSLMSRYLFVHSPAMAVRLILRSEEQPALSELRLEFVTPGWSVGLQARDTCLACLHSLVRALARGRLRLHAVSLPHQPLAPLGVYRRHFGSPVRVAQPHAALLISRSTLKVPLPGVNRTLQQFAADYLQTRFAAPGQGVTARVREALTHTLATGAFDKPRIAAQLAVHPRTLQRRLLAEGTSYESLLDEVRREAALRYLRATRLPFKQIASLLGFSQQSVLTRSCRRWFDVTPNELRGAELRPEGNS